MLMKMYCFSFGLQVEREHLVGQIVKKLFMTSSKIVGPKTANIYPRNMHIAQHDSAAHQQPRSRDTHAP